MKRMLLSTSKRVTVRMLGETYKAALVHQINRVALKTISTLAKAMTRIAIKAASVVGIVLILITLVDFILAMWDPFGYNNMFPKEFPDDMTRAFLSSYFQSMNETLDMVEFLPEFFDDLIEEDDTNLFESLYHILDYVSALEVNSNGQLLNFEDSEIIEDFDEATLVGSALASGSLYTQLDFLEYTLRHNTILYLHDTQTPTDIAMAILWATGALFVMIFQLKSNDINSDYNLTALFFIFLLFSLFLIIKQSLLYYLQLRNYTQSVKPNWYQNLY
ncbi:Hypothetical protein Trvi_ORF17 [Trabala vishnou gigantina nucleopolyhedrovirus]|uniref:Hypothetical protein n=1 Tax=Trabala vishnou gigantina nucleopolyhedrovirus TaxID=2863583 RepID=UPI002481C7EB|nr:Hypothetical protein QKU87_gp017 [Trabala vishnou gigantina nucleopolyhedrovirus]QYC92715.1 Hypothetical protein Trvi_ORF17 [Trabala vishnou gigantina nucleopolyhedrovirus]